MDLTDAGSSVTLISGLAILVGTLGVVIPMLPGLLLCWGGVLFWALLSDAGGGRWVVLALATLIAAAGIVVKYLWPGRKLARTGVPTRSLLLGGALGVVGFFVLPVVGLPVGFVGGVLLAEQSRLGGFDAAWPSTKRALAAVGLSMAVEFAAAVALGLAWLAGVLWA